MIDHNAKCHSRSTLTLDAPGSYIDKERKKAINKRFVFHEDNVYIRDEYTSKITECPKGSAGWALYRMYLGDTVTNNKSSTYTYDAVNNNDIIDVGIRDYYKYASRIHIDRWLGKHEKDRFETYCRPDSIDVGAIREDMIYRSIDNHYWKCIKRSQWGLEVTMRNCITGEVISNVTVDLRRKKIIECSLVPNLLSISDDTMCYSTRYGYVKIVRSKDDDDAPIRMVRPDSRGSDTYPLLNDGRASESDTHPSVFYDHLQMYAYHHDYIDNNK